MQIRRRLARAHPHVLHMNDTHALTGAGLASLGLRLPVRIASRRVMFPIRSVARYRRLCDRVVCISHAVARVCRERGIAPQQISLVQSGVDPQRAASGDRLRGRLALGVDESHRVLLTVATLTDVKGHKYLLEAMPEILQRCPHVRLALAGDGELAGALQSQAERLGIEDRVRFLGYRNDVPDLIMAADLFVLPSHAEGLGSSLIDVMLAGRPIVTTTAGGIPDLVGGIEPTEEPLAWVVPPRDSGKLAAAILEALDSPEQCTVRQRRARRRAERLFTADRMVEATLAVYLEVLQQAVPARQGT
jgi:glycosyltransferase involved in cell wall biosynthesis